MYKHILRFLLILFFSSILYPQTASFDKYYNQFKETDGFIVEETSNSDFIIGGVKGSNLLIVKTDDQGEVKFTKEIPTNSESQNLRTFPVHTTSDGGFIVTTGITGEGFTDLYLAKLDSSGNTVWENTFMDTVSVLGSDAVETDEGDFIVIGSIERNVVQILKIDSDGNKLWSKILKSNPTATLLAGPMIIKLPDGNFLISNDRLLQKITAEGDSLWRISTGFKISVIKTTRESRIIAAGYRNFAVINLEGIIEFNQPLNFTVDSGDNSKEGGYIFLSNGNHLTKTDSVGNIMWEKDILKTGNYISSTSDSGFAVTGNISDNLRLLKTDAKGEFKALFIQNPESYTTLPSFEKFTIRWYSSGIDNIDIEYTMDNGTNWLEVVSGYPADSGFYSWTVPNTPSFECNIRLTSTEDPIITHTLDTVFTIKKIKNYDYISVNEIKMWIGNDGLGSHNPITDYGGFYWPGGEDGEIYSIFQDGLLCGGKFNQQIGITGNTYRSSLEAGAILPDGTPDDPDKPEYAIFKINNDWESLPEGSERDRLEYDYNNWPMELGAPYNDINGDGEYTKGTDTPKFLGDEVLFYVSNDADTAASDFFYSSVPMDLEFQTTVFGFSRDDVLKNVVFKKYNIVNKGQNTINDMYVSYWADTDLGFPADDFVGCDTLLNLAYSYNADEDDEGFYGSPPPAVGHLILQGPIKAGNPDDTARVGESFLPGYKNLSMTAFSLYICSGSPTYAAYACPPFDYEGTLLFYNNMQGMYQADEYYIDPVTDNSTPYCVAGDPVSQTGWFEGSGWPGGPNKGDRYYMLSAGPFTFEPGESQEIIIAIMMAKGEDRLNSITKLRGTAENTIAFYESGFSPGFVTEVRTESTEIPNEFGLSQNYPNPFNPSTTIKYTIPKEIRVQRSEVSIIIYDILGRKVETLVDGIQKPGYYEVEFDGSNYASGMYFYRLKAGDYAYVKKMMLLK